MRQVCLLCDRSALDCNLYCHDIACQAERSPIILDYGEWIGDIEIVRVVTVLRSAVLYEARQKGQRVLLKVAHPGQEHTNRLKREGEILQKLIASKKSLASLPVLLPPYTNTNTIAPAAPYGRAMVGQHLLYYCLYMYVEGEPLRDLLTRTPQLWIYHVGWIMYAIAEAVALLQSLGVLHLAISPDIVLVRFEGRKQIPRILLFDLGIVTTPQALNEHVGSLSERIDAGSGLRPPFGMLPAYTAPELLNTHTLAQTSYSADVYGLGLTLYEMLLGEPAFPFRLQREEALLDIVRRGQAVPMRRSEDVQQAAAIAHRAINIAPDQRVPNALALVAELKAVFGVPSPPSAPNPTLGIALATVIVILGIAFMLTIAASFGLFA